MSHQKPRHRIAIEVPRAARSKTDETAFFEPQVIESTWTRNDHLSPDELKVTIDSVSGGFDIRHLQNARCAFWLWDDAREAFNRTKHYRFSGILMKPERDLSIESQTVTLAFRDWTQLFREKKPYPSDGIPDWNNSLATAWAIICDHTGYWEPESGEIVSSVDVLTNKLACDPPELANLIIGASVDSRFHAISKPTPPKNADAWQVWQYICGALGLVSWIDRDVCRVARSIDHFGEDRAPAFVWGHNVVTMREDADPKITGKGVLLRSFDPLTWQVVEAHYPPIGDPRVKQRRVKVPTALTTTNRAATMHDPLADYVPYNFPGVTDVGALELRARDAYEEMRRQELKGRLTTAEMFLRGVDVLDLGAGDSIRVEIDAETSAHWRSLGNQAERIRYLTSRGYAESVARVIDQNWRDAGGAFDRTMHVESVTTNLKHGHFEIEIAYHSLIRV
jgi:hypothetical protein